MQELIEERNKAKKLLNECIVAKKSIGRKLAQCEYDYKVKRTEWIVKVTMVGYEGSKPIAISVASDFVRGIPEVAKLIYERDIKKADYDVTQEKIYQLKLEINIVEKDIESMRMGG